MSVFNKTMHAILGMLLLVVASNTHATLVNYTITGDVIFGDEYGYTNAFGLTEFETITATGIFDDSVLTGSTGTVLFGAGSGNTMTLNVGTTVFSASNDIEYDLGAPELEFLAGDLFGFDILIYNGVNDATADFSSFFLGFDDLDGLYGEWQTTVVFSPVSAVPVPAAVWLFGSGLLGLIGFAKRK